MRQDRESIEQKKGVKLFFSILIREFFSLLVLNIFLVIGCIPILTAPATIVAVSDLILKMINDQNIYIWMDFRDSFKKNFKLATVSGTPITIASIIFMLGTGVYYRMASVDSIFYPPLAAGFIIIFILISMLIYLYPIIAIVDLPIKAIFKNSFLLIFIAIQYTIFCFGVVVIGGLIFLWFFPYTVLGLVFFPVFNMMILVFTAYIPIKKYIIISK